MRYLYIFDRKNNNSMMYMFLCENFGFKLGNKQKKYWKIKNPQIQIMFI